MMEISTSNNNFYMDKFNEIIEQKHLKENAKNKYNEEIDLFAHEFAKMIMNPQIDKNKNTCLSVKFKIGTTLIENLSDSEIAEYKYITMVIELNKVFGSNILSLYVDDDPFRKLFVKYYKEIDNVTYNKTMCNIMRDMSDKLVTIPGFEDLKFQFCDSDYSIVLQMPIKNPKYSEPAAN